MALGKIIKLWEIIFLEAWNWTSSVNPLSTNLTKWSNTLKQFFGNLTTNCLSVFDHFMGLALKGLSDKDIQIQYNLVPFIYVLLEKLRNVTLALLFLLYFYFKDMNVP